MKFYILYRILAVYAWLEMPMMTIYEQKLFKKILLSLSPYQPLNIFEYGSGLSTLHFAHFLKTNGIAFHWDSLDHNLPWHEKVRDLIARDGLQTQVTLHLRHFTSPTDGHFHPSSSMEQEYIDYPRALGKKYDLIIVDGRFRRRCLRLAMACLNKDGLVLLHDAERDFYHDSCRLYPHMKFFDGGKYYPLERQQHKVWIGSMDYPHVIAL